jgi:hypothetical protein
METLTSSHEFVRRDKNKTYDCESPCMYALCKRDDIKKNMRKSVEWKCNKMR